MVILSEENDTGLSNSDFKRWSRKKDIVVFKFLSPMYYYHNNGKHPIPVDVRYHNDYVKSRVLRHL